MLHELQLVGNSVVCYYTSIWKGLGWVFFLLVQGKSRNLLYCADVERVHSTNTEYKWRFHNFLLLCGTSVVEKDVWVCTFRDFSALFPLFMCHYPTCHCKTANRKEIGRVSFQNIVQSNTWPSILQEILLEGISPARHVSRFCCKPVDLCNLMDIASKLVSEIIALQAHLHSLDFIYQDPNAGRRVCGTRYEIQQIWHKVHSNWIGLHMGLGNYGHVTLHVLSSFQSHSSLFIKFSILHFTLYKSICSHLTFYKHMHKLVIHYRGEETNCFMPTIQPFTRNSHHFLWHKIVTFTLL